MIILQKNLFLLLLFEVILYHTLMYLSRFVTDQYIPFVNDYNKFIPCCSIYIGHSPICSLHCFRNDVFHLVLNFHLFPDLFEQSMHPYILVICLIVTISTFKHHNQVQIHVITIFSIKNPTLLLTNHVKFVSNSTCCTPFERKNRESTRKR